MDLGDKSLRVHDVLDDLRCEDDVERRLRVRQARGDLPVLEDVDLEFVDVDPARFGLAAVVRIELDADELHALVAAEALEQHSARAAEVEDALAGEFAGGLEQDVVGLRVAVLDVEEEALVELPGRVEW